MLQTESSTANTLSPMNPNFSAYLDVVRFLAAMIVFLGHAAGKNWTGGFLWQLGAYGQTAVIIFFVLSGFVIRHVVSVKEKSWQVYTASRVSRLWSVVIPALLVTFVIDTIGVKVAPELYVGKPWFAGDHLWLRYSASLLLVHQVWGADLYPGINIPFWSLSFEFFYYILFGILLYLASYPRYFAFAIVALLAGPLIVAMFPIWWLGVLIYDHKERLVVPKYWALFMAAGGLLLLAASPRLATHPLLGATLLGRPALICDYVNAFAITAHLIGIYSLCPPTAILTQATRRHIATVAATTFPLYLMHRPIMQFFSYIGPAEAASWQRRVLVIFGTLLCIAALTPLTDWLRRRITVWLRDRVFARHDAVIVAESQILTPLPESHTNSPP
ncbi:MAG: putative acyltransferase [Rhodocyclales bacterium]|nr:putative acyltransferase [Rhodocyclales bacterium]